MNRRDFGVRASRLAALFMTFAVSAAVAGCGGPDQSTGSDVQPDPEAAKRQDDMTKYYAKNPLPKPKK